MTKPSPFTVVDGQVRPITEAQHALARAGKPIGRITGAPAPQAAAAKPGHDAGQAALRRMGVDPKSIAAAGASPAGQVDGRAASRASMEKEVARARLVPKHTSS